MTTPDGLEAALLGGSRRYTRAQVAEAAGVPLEFAHELWLSLGFAGVGDDVVVFTDADVEALRTFHTLMKVGVLEPEVARAVARQLGQNASRLATWQVEMMPQAVAGLDMPKEDLADLVANLLPVMDRLQSYVWRRHLAAAAGRMLSDSEDDIESGHAATHDLVVGFADVVGFTRMARRIDTDELAEFVERFESTTADVIVSRGGRVVKTLGDEVLFVVDDPAIGAELGLGLAHAGEAVELFPQLRIGLAYGTVLSRFGDVYGSVVNIAARLTSLALPGTVLVDDLMAEQLQHDDRWWLSPVRPAAVRGYRHLRPWRLRVAGGDEPAEGDPSTWDDVEV